MPLPCLLTQKDLHDAEKRLEKVYGIFRKIDARAAADKTAEGLLNRVLDEFDTLVVFSDGLPETDRDKRLHQLAIEITDWLKRRR